MGPPASGKGTQAELISSKLGYTHISAGDILRLEIRKKTSFGKVIAKWIDRGDLVPDEMVLEMIRKYAKNKKKILFDGIPRSLNQAKIMQKEYKIDKVMWLDIPDKEVIKRISKRRVCECGATYHLITKKPKKSGVCDYCGKRLYQRKDDAPESVKRRLKIFKKTSVPLIKFYKKKKIFHKINGNRQINEVFKDVKKLLST